MRRMARSAVGAGERGACAAAGAWVLYALLGLIALQGAATAAPRRAQTYPECTGACDLGIGDRTRWRRIDTEAGLPDMRVRELEEASDGTLWVATDRGVRWYDGFTFHAVEGPPPIAPSALAALRDGEVAAVFTDGLWRGGRKRWSRIDLARVTFPPAATTITHFTKIRATDAGDL